MNVEANKAALYQFYQSVDRGDTSVVEKLFLPEWENIDANLPPLRGLDGARKLVSLFTQSFPDFTSKIDLIAAEDDRVAVRVTHTGTHRGEFLGIPATGKQVKVTSTGIFTFMQGKLIENRVVFDAFGLLQQLGVVPQ